MPLMSSHHNCKKKKKKSREWGWPFWVPGGVVALAISSFTAAVKFHDLTGRIANFQEKLFRFVVVEEQYEESFWICVASASAHAANLIVVAISQIPLPEIKTKIEEATVTAEDILYW